MHIVPSRSDRAAVRFAETGTPAAAAAPAALLNLTYPQRFTAAAGSGEAGSRA